MAFFILLTHKGSHREVYKEFQPSYDIVLRWCQGYLDHRFRAPAAYTAQLLILLQHWTNNKYRTANQILPILRVSSNSQATLEQSPIQVLTELNVAWHQLCTRTGISKLIGRCSQMNGLMLPKIVFQLLAFPSHDSSHIWYHARKSITIRRITLLNQNFIFLYFPSFQNIGKISTI